jgi:BlaI family transcriptional regulator, penicillinase repressor
VGRKKRQVLTELELDIMQLVWRYPEITVDKLQKELDENDRHLALPSIRTMLDILMEKGYLTRTKQGRGYRYSATISADDAQRSFLKDMLNRVFDNSSIGLVASLLDNKMIPEKDLEQVKKLISNYERKDQDEDN